MSECQDKNGPTCTHCSDNVRLTEHGDWVHAHGLSRCQSSDVAYGHLAHPSDVPCRADGPNPCLGATKANDREEQEPRPWHEFTPEQAVALGDITKRNDVIGPRNEMGDECPWPWDPQQLLGSPIGQYHCPYCGAMVVAGVSHLDYTEKGDSDD